VNDDGVLDVLRHAFRPYLDDSDAPVALSVKVGARGVAGKAQGFHLLFRRAGRVLRTRDPDRLARALVAELSAYRPAPEGLLRLPGVALVRDGEALVACLGVRSSFDLVERRLNASGFYLVDEPFILVDPVAGTLVVPEPALPVDWSALGRIETVVGGQRRAEAAAPPGRYRISRWTYILAEERPEPLPPARGVLWGALLASPLTPVSRADAVRTLAALAERVRPTAATWQHVADGAWCGG
jgi:hypothetical protein